MTYPIPAGRGRWRLTLHKRAYSAPQFPAGTGIAELVDARSRQLTQQWCQAAQLTFSLDGHSDSAAAILELQHDIIAWRWDENTGIDVPMFRGPVVASQDDIGDAHTVTFTCQDYLALLMRRLVTSPTPVNYTNVEQDTIAANLLALAVHPHSGTGTDPFYPGSFLPLAAATVNPDGTTRTTPSGQIRVRAYLGSSIIGTMFDELAKVVNGFDYDVLPRSDLFGVDRLRIFYPSQGVTRTEPALVYGSNVATVSRAVSSADYSNYYRTLGNNSNADQTAAQLYSETWNGDANNVGVYPIGLWMNQDDQADVNVQSTLDAKAQGDVARDGILLPSYTLGLRPGTYSWGNPNMGDTLPLIIQSGRLNVNETQRVMAITFDVTDDGDEDVTLTVARPAVTLYQILAAAHKDIRALSRR